MVLTGFPRPLRFIVRKRRAFGGLPLLLTFILLAAVPTQAPVFAAETGATGSGSATDLSAPPPRTINDITAILDQEKPDPEKIARLTKIADAKPGAGLSGSERVEFFYRRGRAAGELGRVQQWIGDLRKAFGLTKKHGGPTANIARDLVSAELAAGNLREGLKAARRRFQATKSEKGGRRLSSLAVLVRTLIATGQIEEAEKFLGIMQRIAGNLPAGMPADKRSTAEGFVADAESRFFLLTGKLRKAEKSLDEAIAGTRISLEKSAGDDGRVITLENRLGGLQRRKATILRRKGRMAEAEVLVREELLRTLARQGKYTPNTGRNLNALQNIVFAQGRYAEAEKLSRAAEEIFVTVGTQPNSLNLLKTRIAIARALAAQGQWQTAGEIIDRVERDIGSDQALYDETLGQGLEAILIRYRTGKVDAGLQAANGIFERRLAQFGEKHARTAEARGFRALGLSLQGSDVEALKEFRAAIPVLLSSSRQVDQESTLVSAKEDRRKAVFSGYIGLLIRLSGVTGNGLDFDPAEEAFRIADAARAQSVQRAVAASSARAAARDPALAELVRQEQDALREIGALFGLLTSLLSVPAEQRDEEVALRLRETIDALRGKRATIRARLEDDFPDYVRLIDPRPAALADVRAKLRDDEALVATFVDDDQTYIWAAGKTGKVAVAAAPVGRERLLAVTSQLRRALDPSAATLGDIPPFDVKLAHRLYSELLGPVAAGWRDKTQLIVVADGALGQLPLSLLPTEPAEISADQKVAFAEYKTIKWLARSHAVTVMPSVASLIALRSLPDRTVAQRAFVGFGDPIFSDRQLAQTPIPGSDAIASRSGLQTRGLPVTLRSLPKTRGVDSAEFAQLPRLLDTADEIRAMATAMNADMARDVFIGKAASELSVAKTALNDYRVVAFATHGLVPGDLNGLNEPALALTAPKIAGDADGDGLLTMGEIFELRLNADWVVLSACNTGTAAGAGAEAVSGLGRAFFYAGTRALLVSNWPVETTSARILTSNVFARQAAEPGLPRAEALRRARIALVDGPGFVDERSGETLFSYAHPIFWAPFTLIGDGG